MARVVKRTPTEPTEFMIDGAKKWLCKCGLSKTSLSAMGRTN